MTVDTMTEPNTAEYEYAPPERRGFFGSIPQMGVTIGMVMGTLALLI